MMIEDPRGAMFTNERPWGAFEQFTFNEPTTVKVITVAPGQRLSLQTHAKRAEFWQVLDGPLQVTVDDQTWQAERGEKIWIPIGAQHRLGNTADAPGRILEIGFGEFDESDIVRLQDDYSR